jgi:hypothetical protein
MEKKQEAINFTKHSSKNSSGENKMVAPHIKRRRRATAPVVEEKAPAPAPKKVETAPAPKKEAPAAPKKVNKTYKKKED